MEATKELEKDGGGEDDEPNGAAKPEPPVPAEPKGPPPLPKVKGDGSGDLAKGAKDGCAGKEVEADEAGPPKDGAVDEPKVKGADTAGAEDAEEAAGCVEEEAPKVKGAVVEGAVIAVDVDALEGAEKEEEPPKVNSEGADAIEAEDVDRAEEDEEEEEDAKDEEKLKGVEEKPDALLEPGVVEGAAGNVNEGAAAALEAPKVKPPEEVELEAPNIGAVAVDEGKENGDDEEEEEEENEDEEEEKVDDAPVGCEVGAPKVKGTAPALPSDREEVGAGEVNEAAAVDDAVNGAPKVKDGSAALDEAALSALLPAAGDENSDGADEEGAGKAKEEGAGKEKPVEGGAKVEGVAVVLSSSSAASPPPPSSSHVLWSASSYDMPHTGQSPVLALAAAAAAGAALAFDPAGAGEAVVAAEEAENGGAVDEAEPKVKGATAELEEEGSGAAGKENRDAGAALSLMGARAGDCFCFSTSARRSSCPACCASSSSWPPAWLLAVRDPVNPWPKPEEAADGRLNRVDEALA